MRLFYLLFSSAHVLMARRAQRLKSPAGASSCLRGLPGQPGRPGRPILEVVKIPARQRACEGPNWVPPWATRYCQHPPAWAMMAAFGDETRLAMAFAQRP
jgi:hypothetical protein